MRTLFWIVYMMVLFILLFIPMVQSLSQSEQAVLCDTSVGLVTISFQDPLTYWHDNHPIMSWVCGIPFAIITLILMMALTNNWGDP